MSTVCIGSVEMRRAATVRRKRSSSPSSTWGRTPPNLPAHFFRYLFRTPTRSPQQLAHMVRRPRPRVVRARRTRHHRAVIARRSPRGQEDPAPDGRIGSCGGNERTDGRPEAEARMSIPFPSLPGKRVVGLLIINVSCYLLVVFTTLTMWACLHWHSKNFTG
jgi:hypothetical protein